MTHRLQEGVKGGLYALIVFLLHLLARVLFRLRVTGRNMLNRGTGYIIVARHRSYWDIPLLAVALGMRNRIHFIARKGLLKNPLFHLLIKLYATAIDRDHFSRADFRRLLDAVQRERLIGIFPEGTTKAGADAKAGAIHFARLSGKELVPVNIKAEGPYPPRYPFRFPRVTISIGRPVPVTALDDGTGTGRVERERRMSQRLMELIDAA